MLVATAQMEMKWTVEENHSSMMAIIERAAKFGAGMVLFPELSITGFHREIVNEAGKLQEDPQWVEAIRSSCSDNSVFAWIGLPTFEDELIYNSYVLVGPDGELVSEVRKEGLTESEKTLFSSGNERPTSEIEGCNFTAVMCREVADLDHLNSQLCQSELNGIVWPGFLSHGLDEAVANREGTAEQAAKVAKSLGCEIVQCNWANSLNKPEMVNLGGSVYLNNLGEVVWRCPEGISGIGFVDLTSSECRWDSTFD